VGAEAKHTTTYGVRNPCPGLEQAQNVAALNPFMGSQQPHYGSIGPPVSIQILNKQ